MSKRESSNKPQERRKFLAGVVGVSGAAAVTAVSATLLGENGINTVNRSATRQSQAIPKSKGYHLTEHIQRYYDTLNE